jgi:N-acyl-D-amino-acid deacylase
MRVLLITLACALCLAAGMRPAPAETEEPLDLIIQGGRLLDGTGEKIFAADIGIRGGKIAEIGYIEKPALRTIDARGYWVTPGFIDLYSVPDRRMFKDTRWLGAVFQGVTTLVIDGEQRPNSQNGFDPAVPPYAVLSRLQKDGLVLNAAAFAGLRQLHAAQHPAENPPPPKPDTARLKQALEQALEQGAAGLSYDQDEASDFSISKSELSDLVRVTASRGGVYATILRPAGKDPLPLLSACLEIAKTTQARTLIRAIHWTAGAQIDQFAGLIEAARGQGAEVLADFFPYSRVIPAAEAEETILRTIRLPWVGLGSAGPALSLENARPNTFQPRTFGTFARALGRYTRENHALSSSEYGNSEEMVRRMTLMPARFMGFMDRGRLAPGMAADIAVFHPEEFRDLATEDQPARYAAGVRWLLVNGALVLDDGKFTGAKPGRMLVPAKSTPARRPPR